MRLGHTEEKVCGDRGEMRVSLPHIKEHLEPPGAGRHEKACLAPLEGACPADTLMLDFGLPGLRGNTFLLLCFVIGNWNSGA